MCTVGAAANRGDPLSKIPAQQRESLAKRLSAYVRVYTSRNWAALYGLVSDVGRGGVTPQDFVVRMKAAHGLQFAQDPDLLEFRPDHAEPNGKGYDIYGCGKARREGMMFNGIAVTHAVFEHNDWFFTGWSFTEFPNEPCKDLMDPAWRPDSIMGWDQPMEELRVPHDISVPSKPQTKPH